MLLLMIDMYDEGIFNNSEDDYYDQYTDNEAEFSTEASVDPDIRGEEDGHCYRQNNWNKQNEEIENESEQKPKRRKKNREDYDFSYEAISNRILEMQFREQDRVQCNVSEQWIDRMRLKANSLKSN